MIAESRHLVVEGARARRRCCTSSQEWGAILVAEHVETWLTAQGLVASTVRGEAQQVLAIQEV